MVVELEVQLVVAGVAGLDVQGALAEAVCLAAVAAMPPPPDAPADGHGVVEDSDDASGESCLMEEGLSEDVDEEGLDPAVRALIPDDPEECSLNINQMLVMWWNFVNIMCNQVSVSHHVSS